MISVYHYISASRRLDRLEKDIIMMGGSHFNDDDIPWQLAAQRYMLRNEVTYYQMKLKRVGVVFTACIIIAVLVLVVMAKLGVL